MDPWASVSTALSRPLARGYPRYRMPSTAPLLELTEVWRALRDRMLAAATILVVGEDEPQARRICAALAGDGWAASGTADVEAARAAIAARAPDVLLVAFRGPADPRRAFFAPELHDLAHPVLGAVATPVPALEAMRAGADDVLLSPLPPERVLARLRARLRQGVTIRLVEQLAAQVVGIAQSAGLAAPVLDALPAQLERHRALRRERGTRLLFATQNDDTRARITGALAPLGLPIITVESAAEASEVARFAALDAAILDAMLPDGPAPAVAALRAADPHVQIAVVDRVEAADAADGALDHGAVTALRIADVADDVVAAVVARLAAAREHLAVHETVALEAGRSAPELLDRWRAHLAVSSPLQPAEAAALAENRRRDVRLPAAVPILVVPVDPPGDAFAGATTNLSLSGAFVASSTVLAPRAVIECRVQFADIEVALDGMVVRAGDGSSPDGRLVPGFAVRFPRVEKESLRRLVEIVRRIAHGL